MLSLSFPILADAIIRGDLRALARSANAPSMREAPLLLMTVVETESRGDLTAGGSDALSAAARARDFDTHRAALILHKTSARGDCWPVFLKAPPAAAAGEAGTRVSGFRASL